MKFPLPPQEPLTDATGHVTNAWWRSFAGIRPTTLNVAAGTTTGTPDGDAIVFVVQQSGGVLAPTTLQISNSPTWGQVLYVKDAFGLASVNPITLSPPTGVLIDGKMQAIINTNYGFLLLSWNGVGWSILGSPSAGPTGASGVTGPTGPTGP